MMQVISTNDRIQWKLMRDKQFRECEFLNGDGIEVC